MPRTETVTFKANTSHFKRGIREMAQRAKAFAGTMTKVSAIAIPLAGVAGGVGLIKTALEGIDKAATFETLELQLGNVLKSSKEAAVIFGNVQSFSASTPFQVADITQGVTALSMANKQLGTSKELWLEVGDTAAKGGRQFSEVAKQVGKFLSATESATGSIATPLESLSSDMGVISPQQKDDLLGLKKAGADAMTLQQAFRAMMRENEGNMQRQSASWNGLKSTLADVKDLIIAAFGSGIIKNLKPIIVDITEKLKSWEPIMVKWGEKVAKTIKNIYLALTDDSGKGLELFVLGLEIAAKSFANILFDGMILVAKKFGEYLKNVASENAEGLGSGFLEGANPFGGVIPKEPNNAPKRASSKDDGSLFEVENLKARFISSLNPNAVSKFDAKNKELAEGMKTEQDTQKDVSLQQIVETISSKIKSLDFEAIKKNLGDKTLSIYGKLRKKLIEANLEMLEDKRQKQVSNFEGNSIQLRPVSSLTSHGGGGVYGATGTQRFEQQMLSKTNQVVEILGNIYRQSENNGGATFR